jgi:hypothetical protein
VRNVMLFFAAVFLSLVSMLGATTLVITAILIRAEPPSGLSRGV